MPGFSPDFVLVHALKRALEIRGYVAIESNFFDDVVIVDFQKFTIVECQKNISNLINQMASEYDYVIGVRVSLGGALLIEHAKSNDNLYGVISIGTDITLYFELVLEFRQVSLQSDNVIPPVFDTILDTYQVTQALHGNDMYHFVEIFHASYSKSAHKVFDHQGSNITCSVPDADTFLRFTRKDISHQLRSLTYSLPDCTVRAQFSLR